jgi:alpha-galactosidase
MMKTIKLAYIGGGSKAWARVFMNDLALTEEFCGEIALYDIDLPAAERNRQIGERINAHPDTVSHWNYVVYDRLEDALRGADFVACSILPGTFDAMQSDVHAPEKYGIWQSVGDTVGPGGVLRAMRTVPLYEEFARTIRNCCPKAWVINLTNPMTICCKTLFDVFPEIRAFGCCHEVFNAEEFLCCVLKEELGIPRPDRHELVVDASGINHFTWITEARWQGQDVLTLLPGFMEKYYEKGYCEKPGAEPEDFCSDPFRYGNRVKMDLFRRYGILAAAGDRHLVEFLNKSWYLDSPADAEQWLYHLTTVDYRKEDQQKKIAESIAVATGVKPVTVQRSPEELIELMKAILGFGPVISNANTLNRGQMPQLPLGSVVEVNHVFDNDCVRPVLCNALPGPVSELVLQNAMNIENLYAGIRDRDLNVIFSSFMAQPLCSQLNRSRGEELFHEMIMNTAEYLEPWFDLGTLK